MPRASDSRIVPIIGSTPKPSSSQAPTGSHQHAALAASLPLANVAAGEFSAGWVADEHGGSRCARWPHALQ